MPKFKLTITLDCSEQMANAILESSRTNIHVVSAKLDTLASEVAKYRPTDAPNVDITLDDDF